MTEEAATRSALGVYGISVASELSGLGSQTLRLYETRGLIAPARTEGGSRRYSEDDLFQLRRITELLAAGVNLAGIAQIFDLQTRNTQLESENASLMSDNARLEARRVTVDERPSRRKKGKNGMTMNVEGLPVADGRPEADVVAQLTPVIDSVDDAGLDPAYVTKARDWEADQADVIDQAISVALPDDDYEHERQR